MAEKKTQTQKKPATAGPSVVSAIPPQQQDTETPSPVSNFPVDPVEPLRRGPGRPPKICPTCGKSASECRGHEPEKFSIGTDTVKGLFQMLGHMTALSFSLSTGVPIEKMAPLWQFSDGETAMLAPPTAELINKNAPEWLLKFETEIKVALVLVPIVIGKLTITHAVVQMHKKELEAQNPPQVVPSATAMRSEATTRTGAAAA